MKNNTTRDNIIKAAMAIFAREDFNRATMRSIAKKARIVPSNIYKYFENKDQLLSELLNIVAEKIMDGARKELVGLNSTKEKIYRLTRYYLDYYQNNPGLTFLIYGRNTLQHWYEYNTIYSRARELGNMLVKIVEEGQRKGEVRPDIDLHLISHIYHGGLRNLVTSWLYHNQDFPLTESSQHFADIIYFAVSVGADRSDTFICPYYKEKLEKSK